MDLAAWWKFYSDNGYSTIPLKTRGKIPFLAWTKYQTTRATPEEINYWIKKYKDNNVAILTGAISGIIVLDIDGPEGWRYLKEHGFVPPPTPRVQTSPGKAHFYFKHPGYEIRNQTNADVKIDIRGDGGYVVAPPSIHETGSHYSWVENFSPLDIPLAEMPPWLTQFIAERVVGVPPVAVVSEQKKVNVRAKEEVVLESKPGVSGVVLDTDRAEESRLVEEASEYARIMRGVSDGERNDACKYLVGYYLRHEMPNDAILVNLEMWDANNNPPLGTQVLKTTILSVKRFVERKKKQSEPVQLKVTPADYPTIQEYQSDTLDFLSSHCRVRIERIEILSGDKPQYVFHISSEDRGKRTLWLHMSEITIQQRFRDRFGPEAGEMPKKIESKKGVGWEVYINKILSCAVPRAAGPESTATGELLAKLEEYLKGNTAVSIDTDKDVSVLDNPFIWKGVSWFTLGDFLRWVATHRNKQKISHQETVQRLAMEGFEEARFRLPAGKDGVKRMQRNYWRIPSDFLQERGIGIAAEEGG